MKTTKAEPGNWIPVNASALIRGSRTVEPQAPGDSGRDEGTFTVSLSPYDVPEAVRAHVDNWHNCFVIDLRYITSEPTVEVWKDPVTLMRGAGSGRIYQIKVLAPDIKAIEWGVPKEIRQALKKLEEDEQQGFGPRERIKVVESVLKQEEESLFKVHRPQGIIAAILSAPTAQQFEPEHAAVLAEPSEMQRQSEGAHEVGAVPIVFAGQEA
jgi:hypothetical protein